MNRQFHGVLSLLLVFGALIAGLVSMFRESVAMGIVYLVIILVSVPTIVYAYC
jgi:TM2 domain-containing membrane protein YozV